MALRADELAELYDRHAEALLAFVVRRTWDPEVAVDILAETFAVALEGRRRFRGHDDQGARAWLYGIARNQVADHFRRDGAQRRALEHLGIERRPLTDVEYERIEELAGSRELRDRVADLRQHGSARDRLPHRWSRADARRAASVALKAGVGRGSGHPHFLSA